MDEERKQKRVRREEIVIARGAPLAEYLLYRFPDEFELRGTGVVDKQNLYFSIPLGFAGYHDFKSGAHGNPIDYLKTYKGMTFLEAVHDLCRFQSMDSLTSKALSPVSIPRRNENCTEHMVGYLVKNGIPDELVNRLIREELVYEDMRSNAVFVSKSKDYCEIYGTGKSEYYRCLKASSNVFWHFPVVQKAIVVYLCQNVIDALSLYILKSGRSKAESSVFVSLGTIDCQKAIDRIAAQKNVFLALNNSPEGDSCRKRNPNIAEIRPILKTWHDDLIQGYNKRFGR